MIIPPVPALVQPATSVSAQRFCDVVKSYSAAVRGVGAYHRILLVDTLLKPNQLETSPQERFSPGTIYEGAIFLPRIRSASHGMRTVSCPISLAYTQRLADFSLSGDGSSLEMRATSCDAVASTLLDAIAQNVQRNAPSVAIHYK